MFLEEGAKEETEVLHEILLLIRPRVVRFFDVGIDRNHRLQLLHRLAVGEGGVGMGEG